MLTTGTGGHRAEGFEGEAIGESFAVALRRAIAGSGLPLERVRHQLRARGVDVSAPTLSNWQAGRRRPGRVESLRAVSELEVVLRLPRDALLGLLDAPRPRGGPDGVPRAPAVAPRRVVRLSQHDVVTVDRGGRVRRLVSRLVLRAGADGVARWGDTWLAAGRAEVVGEWQCHVVRAEVDRRGRTGGAEFALDEPLARDRTAIVEYRVEFGDLGGPYGRFMRRFPDPVGEYVMDVRFSESAIPAVCRRGSAGRALAPSRSGSVHVVRRDATGLVDLTWRM